MNFQRTQYQGITASTLGNLQFINDNTWTYASGGNLIIENHNGKIQVLPIHDNDITAFDVSSNKKWILMGQIGTENYKEKKAFISLVNVQKFDMEEFYQEFEDEILDLKFSPDDNFFAATGKDFRLIIYSLKEKRIVFQVQEQRIFPFINWIMVDEFPQLIMVNSYKIRIFSIDKKHYPEYQEQYQMLSSQTKRCYLTTVIDQSQRFVFGGTSGGEISIFSLKFKALEQTQQICNSPIILLKKLNNGQIFCQSRENIIYTLNFDGKEFEIIKKFQIESQILNINFLKDLGIGIMQNGSLIKYQSQNEKIQIIRHVPIEKIVQTVLYDCLNILIQLTISGSVIFFDIEEKRIIQIFKYETKQQTKGNQMTLSEITQTLIVCYENDDIIALDISQLNTGKISQKWKIYNAHKGKITSTFLNEKYLLTSCDDSLLRIWHAQNQKLIHELNYHRNEVTLCQGFEDKPSIIISAGKDKQMIIFDLIKEKKLNNFMIINGYIEGVLFQNENTLISYGYNCPVLFWNLQSNKSFDQIEENSVKKAQLSPCKKYIALLKRDNFLKVYELSNKMKIFEQRLNYMDVEQIYWNKEGILGSDKSGAYYVLKKQFNFKKLFLKFVLIKNLEGNQYHSKINIIQMDTKEFNKDFLEQSIDQYFTKIIKQMKNNKKNNECSIITQFIRFLFKIKQVFFFPTFHTIVKQKIIQLKDEIMLLIEQFQNDKNLILIEKIGFQIFELLLQILSFDSKKIQSNQISEIKQQIDSLQIKLFNKKSILQIFEKSILEILQLIQSYSNKKEFIFLLQEIFFETDFEQVSDFIHQLLKPKKKEQKEKQQMNFSTTKQDIQIQQKQQNDNKKQTSSKKQQGKEIVQDRNSFFFNNFIRNATNEQKTKEIINPFKNKEKKYQKIVQKKRFKKTNQRFIKRTYMLKKQKPIVKQGLLTLKNFQNHQFQRFDSQSKKNSQLSSKENSCFLEQTLFDIAEILINQKQSSNQFFYYSLTKIKLFLLNKINQVVTFL